MTLSVTCPNCDKTINVDEKYAGKSGACPGCGKTLEIPTDQPAPPLEPPSQKGPPHRQKPALIPDEIPESLADQVPVTLQSPETPVTPFKGMTFFQANIIIILLLIGLGFSFTISLTPRTQKPKPRWEYKIESPSDIGFESTMDRYGADGWEAVTARRAKGAGEFGTYSYEIIFKRPK